MTLDEVLKQIKALVDENHDLEVGDTPTLLNILKKAPNFEAPELKIKEYSFDKKLVSFEYEKQFYLISFEHYSQTIEDFAFQKLKTEEEFLSLLAQKELEAAIQFLEEFIDAEETDTTFKRQPNFLDWLNEHWEVSFEFSEIRIIKNFFKLSENKYSTYQYWTSSYLENRGVFYQIYISGWEHGDYQLDGCSFVRFENEKACKKAILDTQLETYSLFTSSNGAPSADMSIRNLEQISPETLVQELTKIISYLSLETKQALFENLKAHLEEKE